MIEFTCLHCEERVRYEDHLGGLRLKCRSCFVPVDVPKPTARVAVEAEGSPGRSAQDSVSDLSGSLCDTDLVEEAAPPVSLRGLAQEFGATVEPLPALLEVAGPELYRGNPFRVAGLGAEATPRELERQLQRVAMAEKLGPGVRQPVGPFALDPAPGLSEIREAVERLRDPEHRLVHEFFWFWPARSGHGREDAALAALAQGDVDGARQHWLNADPAAAGVARHNLAVLAHLRALDLEGGAAGATPGEREAMWKEAFGRWTTALADEGCWDRMLDRICDWNEPQITEVTLHRLRHSLPAALLSINARLAARAAEAGNANEATRHVELVRHSGFPKTAVEDALRGATEPIRDRLQLLGENAEAEAGANPEQGITAAERLLADTHPLLVSLTHLLPKGHALLDGCHDEAAMRVLACADTFGNKTLNWFPTVASTRHAAELARGAMARDTFQQRFQFLDGWVAYYGCWFCKCRRATDADSYGVAMHGNVTRQYRFLGPNTLNWNYVTVRVPRCPECRRAHYPWDYPTLLGGLVGLLFGLGVRLLVNFLTGGWFSGLLALSGCIALGGIVGSILNRLRFGREVRPLRYAKKHPDVLQRRRQGWAFGHRPPGA